MRPTGLLLPVSLLLACAPSAVAPRFDGGADAEVVADASSKADVPAAPDAPPPLVCTGEPASPVVVGRCALAEAGGGAVAVLVHGDAGAEAFTEAVEGWAARGAESFVLARRGERVAVVGRDPVGAMYGAFELAERLHREGAAALALPGDVVRSPAVSVRAANLFLAMPHRGESRWWFLERDFWRDYLDVLARARVNILDLHGMYNPENTLFPNALLFFATAPSMPEVGVPAAERARNLAMLREVVAMARRRGIRVMLMTYRSDLDPWADDAPPPGTERSARYTREAVEQLARAVPELDRLGFRIGESGTPAAWYNRTFVDAVRASGAPIGIVTRTWLADPAGIAEVQRHVGDDLMLEAKYNGEHLGAPYPVLGGIWSSDWHPYSYQRYLSTPERYRFVFQVRAGGTHRAFRQASFAQARRAVAHTLHGGAQGFSYEAAHAYQTQWNFLHASPRDAYARWSFRRDELTYHLWGRLGYDPETPERAFRDLLARRTGADALWAPFQAAGEVVPWIAQGFLCGPDHRDVAPDLEWGGPTAVLAEAPFGAPVANGCAAYRGPMDPFTVAPVYDTVQDLLAGRGTPRLTVREVSERLLAAAREARRVTEVRYDPRNAEARDVARETLALADLGDYWAHKLRAAVGYGVFAGSRDSGWRAFAVAEQRAAVAAWRALVEHTGYVAPFDEPLRMRYLGLRTFHWGAQRAWVEGDLRAFEASLDRVEASPPDGSVAVPSPAQWLALARPSVRVVRWQSADAPAGHQVSVTLDAPLPEGARAWLLWKTIDGEAPFHRADLARDGDALTTTVETGSDVGLVTALELRFADGRAVRLPDAREATPWVVLADARGRRDVP